MKKFLMLFLLLLPMSAAAEDASISILNYKFVPETLTVKVGTKVTWKNADQIPHGVATKEKLFRSPAIDTNETWSFTYDKPGTYAYFCTLHPYMTGTVTVTQ